MSDGRRPADAFSRAFGRRIQTVRAMKLGITQRELGVRLGYDPAVMSRIENGDRVVDTRRLNHLADVLGVSLDYLFGRADE